MIREKSNDLSGKSTGWQKTRALQILDAAAELFSRSGYQGVSARDIARQAGVTKALVFYYWGSKAELFERVLERYYARHKEALQGCLESAKSPQERVRRMLDAYLDFIEKNHLYPRLVQQLLAGNGENRDLVWRHLTPFFDWTTRLLADVTPPSGPLSARHFYLSICGIVISYFTYTPALGSHWQQDPMDPAALAERREHVSWLIDTLLARLQSGDSKGETT